MRAAFSGHSTPVSLRAAITGGGGDYQKATPPSGPGPGFPGIPFPPPRPGLRVEIGVPEKLQPLPADEDQLGLPGLAGKLYWPVRLRKRERAEFNPKTARARATRASPRRTWASSTSAFVPTPAS